MVLGVVAGDALGLTPVVFLVAGLFFVITMATYVEGNSLHPERGGASTFARYAFDELWSFVAGWAILLDYLIVMAIGAVAISDYLAVFWTELDDGRRGDRDRRRWRSLFVALQNMRGLGGRPARHGAAPVAARDRAAGRWCRRSRFAQELGPGGDHRHRSTSAPRRPGTTLLFATVVAAVALIGVEAASGLAGEVRVGRQRPAPRGAGGDAAPRWCCSWACRPPR